MGSSPIYSLPNELIYKILIIGCKIVSKEYNFNNSSEVWIQHRNLFTPNPFASVARNVCKLWRVIIDERPHPSYIVAAIDVGKETFSVRSLIRLQSLVVKIVPTFCEVHLELHRRPPPDISTPITNKPDVDLIYYSLYCRSLRLLTPIRDRIVKLSMPAYDQKFGHLYQELKSFGPLPMLRILKYPLVNSEETHKSNTDVNGITETRCFRSLLPVQDGLFKGSSDHKLEHLDVNGPLRPGLREKYPVNVVKFSLQAELEDPSYFVISPTNIASTVTHLDLHISTWRLHSEPKLGFVNSVVNFPHLSVFKFKFELSWNVEFEENDPRLSQILEDIRNWLYSFQAPNLEKIVYKTSPVGNYDYQEWKHSMKPRRDSKLCSISLQIPTTWMALELFEALIGVSNPFSVNFLLGNELDYGGWNDPALQSSVLQTFQKLRPVKLVIRFMSLKGRRKFLKLLLASIEVDLIETLLVYEKNGLPRLLPDQGMPDSIHHLPSLRYLHLRDLPVHDISEILGLIAARSLKELTICDTFYSTRKAMETLYEMERREDVKIDLHAALIQGKAKFLNWQEGLTLTLRYIQAIASNLPRLSVEIVAENVIKQSRFTASKSRGAPLMTEAIRDFVEEAICQWGKSFQIVHMDPAPLFTKLAYLHHKFHFKGWAPTGLEVEVRKVFDKILTQRSKMANAPFLRVVNIEISSHEPVFEEYEYERGFFLSIWVESE